MYVIFDRVDVENKYTDRCKQIGKLIWFFDQYWSKILKIVLLDL